jgi:hypothetical protein
MCTAAKISTITAIVEAFVAREDDRDWAPSHDIVICASLVHTRGSLVRVCPDDAWVGFSSLQVPNLVHGPAARPSEQGRA